MYHAIFFSIDWDYQREWNFETIKEAENYIAKIWSRWFFYPLCYVCTDKYLIKENGKRWRTIRTILLYLSGSYNADKEYDECELQYLYDSINNF